MYSNHCFVDTSAWFAFFVPTDINHKVVTTPLLKNNKRLLTTDFILDELLSLLRVRGENRRTKEAWDFLLSPSLVTLLYLTENDLNQSWYIFNRFHDKGWSFTDCTSKHVIQSYKIKIAASLDNHFHQFGGLVVIPA